MAINGNEASFPTLHEGSPIRLNLPEAGTFLVVEYHAKEMHRKQQDKRVHGWNDDADSEERIARKIHEVHEHALTADPALVVCQSM